MVGVYIGSGIGGFEVIEREHQVLLEHGPRRISPFFIPATIVNLASAMSRFAAAPRDPTPPPLRVHHQRAFDWRFLPHDPARDADAMICGGTEARSRRCRSAVSPPCARYLRAMTNRNARPALGPRPGRLRVGEGAGILVIEELEFARRGARAFWRRSSATHERRRISSHRAIARW